MLNHTFTFNGHTSDEFGIKIERFRALSRPGRKFDAASVPGRNGILYNLQDAWEEVLVSYEIFAEADATSLESRWTDIMEWLNSADDYAELSDTYDTTHYRLALFVDSTDIQNSWNHYGRAVVSFRCRPERFLANTEINLNTLSTATVWKIISSQTSIALDIDSATPIYAVDRLLPNDRFIVLDTVEDPDDPPNTINKIITLDGKKTGWCYGKYTESFQMYKLVNPTNHVAKPFISFNMNIDHTNTEADITINTINLNMQYRDAQNASAYHDLYIDCETENVYGTVYTSEILSYNGSTEITNVDGTAATKYLYLQSGDNYLSTSVWDGGVTPQMLTVTIKPRFWEI